MSYSEYRGWVQFYADCGGFPHEVADIRWARQLYATAQAEPGKLSFDGLLFVRRNRRLPRSREQRPVAPYAHTEKDLTVMNELLGNLDLLS